MTKLRLKQLARDGAVNGDVITFNTTTQLWEPAATATLSVSAPTASNKDQSPLATAPLNEQPTGLILAETPVGDKFVTIDINGVSSDIGDGVKTSESYFSDDGGITAKSFVNIVAGDELFWNSIVAGFVLSPTDNVDFDYDKLVPSPGGSSVPLHASTHNQGGTDELTAQLLGSDAAPAGFVMESDGLGGWNLVVTPIGTNVTTGNTGWVDSINGNDGTAVFGELTRPFLTVQAAVTAAYASGSTNVSIVVGPGIYNEDVICPVIGSNKVVSIIGYGSDDVSRIRSLEVNPPTAGNSMQFVIQHMAFGIDSGGMTKESFIVANGAGDLNVSIGDSTFFSDTNNIDVALIASGAGGSLNIRLNNAHFDTNASNVSAFVAGRGSISGHAIFIGSGSPAVVLSGTAEFVSREATLITDGAGVDAMTSTSTGVVALTTAFVEVEPASTGAAFTGTGGAPLLVENMFFQRSGGSGGISNTGPVLMGFVSDNFGLFPTVTGAPLIRLGQLNHLQNIPSGAMTSTVAQDAVDELAAGRSNYTSINFAASPYTALLTDNIIGVDTSGGPITVDLPAAATAGLGKLYIIKDEAGNAAANNITIDPSGLELIDGGLTFPIAVNDGAAAIYCTSSAWFVY